MCKTSLFLCVRGVVFLVIRLQTQINLALLSTGLEIDWCTEMLRQQLRLSLILGSLYRDHYDTLEQARWLCPPRLPKNSKVPQSSGNT